MSFIKENKDFKELRKEWLHRKWGFTNPIANEGCEQTRKLILEMVLSRWDALEDDKSKLCDCSVCKEHPLQTVKEYYEDVLKDEEKWKRIWEEQYANNQEGFSRG